jgi:hypothetical protein
MTLPKIKLKEAVIHVRKQQWQIESAKQQLIAKIQTLLTSQTDISEGQNALASAISKTRELAAHEFNIITQAIPLLSSDHASLRGNFNKLPAILEYVRDNGSNVLNTIFSSDDPTPAEYDISTKLTATLPLITRSGQARDPENSWGTSKTTYDIGALTVAYFALKEGSSAKDFDSNSPVHHKAPLNGATIGTLQTSNIVSKFLGEIDLTMINCGFLWGGHRFQQPKEYGPHDASSFVQYAEFGNVLPHIGHTTGDLYRAYLWNSGNQDIVRTNHTEWSASPDAQLTSLYDAVPSGEERIGDVRIVIRGISLEKPLGGGGSMGIVTALHDGSVDILECNRDMPGIEGAGIGNVSRVATSPTEAVAYLRLRESQPSQDLAEAVASIALDDEDVSIDIIVAQTDAYMMAHPEELINIFGEIVSFE